MKAGRWKLTWYFNEFEQGKHRQDTIILVSENKGNNKITELRTILQRESQNS